MLSSGVTLAFSLYIGLYYELAINTKQACHEKYFFHKQIASLFRQCIPLMLCHVRFSTLVKMYKFHIAVLRL
jgi:hypothetical protein